MPIKRLTFALGIILILLSTTQAVEIQNDISPGLESAAYKIRELKNKSAPLTSLSLQDCIAIALELNRRRAVFALNIKIAQYRHKQALSSYWPRLLINSTYSRMDEDIDFIFPEETADYTISGIAPLPVTSTVTVPQKTVKVTDRDKKVTYLDFSLPLYTGGTRKAASDQAAFGVQAAKQSARRTDLELIYDVKRMYYGLVLAQELERIGNNTLSRLSATLQLTEQLYKNSAAQVTKADYLKNKDIDESVRSALADLERNKKIAYSAIINSMGLPWNVNFKPSETGIPYIPYSLNINKLISCSYKFNPDWNRISSGLKAAEALVKKEKGERLPKLLFTGTIWQMDRSYNGGIESNSNKDGWKMAIGIQIPIFDGFLAKNRISEANAHFSKIKNEKILLKDKIAFQVNHILISLNSFQKKKRAEEKAKQSAIENSDLNMRAYRIGLVQAQDVIEAQLLESFLKARYMRTLYNHAEARFQMELTIGTEINKLVDID